MLTQNIFYHSCSLVAPNEGSFVAYDSLLSRLSQLSQSPNWLLFTAETTLPTISELNAFAIDNRKVVKIKPSLLLSEKQIILKALSLNNASAIVASDNFETDEKAELLNKAEQVGCEIFFMDKTIRQSLVRNLH